MPRGRRKLKDWCRNCKFCMTGTAGNCWACMYYKFEDLEIGTPPRYERKPDTEADQETG